MPAKIHGRLGASSLAAATDTSLYSVPGSRKATVNVSICNRNAAIATVRLAHVDGALGALASEDYIEYEAEIAPGGVIERTQIPMTATHSIVGRASTTGVSFQVVGIEEDV